MELKSWFPILLMVININICFGQTFPNVDLEVVDSLELDGLGSIKLSDSSIITLSGEVINFDKNTLNLINEVTFSPFIHTAGRNDSIIYCHPVSTNPKTYTYNGSVKDTIVGEFIFTENFVIESTTDSIIVMEINGTKYSYPKLFPSTIVEAKENGNSLMLGLVGNGDECLIEYQNGNFNPVNRFISIFTTTSKNNQYIVHGVEQNLGRGIFNITTNQSVIIPNNELIRDLLITQNSNIIAAKENYLIEFSFSNTNTDTLFQHNKEIMSFVLTDSILVVFDRDSAKVFKELDTLSVSTQIKLEEPTVKIYPNPVSQTLNVEIPPTNTEISIFIYDIQGRVIYNRENFIEQKIDCSNFQKGTYFLKVKSDNKLSTRKIIVN